MLTLNHVTPVLKTLQDTSSLILKTTFLTVVYNTVQDLAARSPSDLTSAKGDVVHWSTCTGHLTVLWARCAGLRALVSALCRPGCSFSRVRHGSLIAYRPCSHVILSEAFSNVHILKIVIHPLRFIASHLSFLLYALVPPNALYIVLFTF